MAASRFLSSHGAGLPHRSGFPVSDRLRTPPPDLLVFTVVEIPADPGSGSRQHHSCSGTPRPSGFLPEAVLARHTDTGRTAGCRISIA